MRMSFIEQHGFLVGLFHNPDAVLQRAGFWKSDQELKALGRTFVTDSGGHEKAQALLVSFLDGVKARALDRVTAQAQVLEFLGIEKDDSGIF